MALSACCSKYTRLANVTKKFKFPYNALSYINVTLCVYTVMLLGYMLTFNNEASYTYLQYYITLSVLMLGTLNLPTLWSLIKSNEAHEIIYEMKLFHAMCFSNIIVNYFAFSGNKMIENYVFVNNLIHVCMAVFVFVELLVLLGHTMNVYIDYQLVKTSYVMIMFVIFVIVSIIARLECLKSKLFDNSLTFNVLLCALYIVIGIVWSLKQNLIDHCEKMFKNVRVVPFIVDDPPPPFSTLEMNDIIKTNEIKTV
ncbi:hypothetical protein [Palpita vitrealis nucleopolyhedrovirus]|uniref:Ac124 n=1 Tax=Palpita vitrealis nucleopolyhedrovirus TaxID=2951960 RepID=A0AAE9LNL0_9ABAC|nr:hypothetical protein [Palpita vitrealis nucleopolyhedrovirus]